MTPTEPPQRRFLTNAVLATLNGSLPFKVGDGEAPAPTLGQSAPELPYGVLWSVPGGRVVDAPLSDGQMAMVTWIYELTVVGRSRKHVEAAQDRARSALLARENHAFVNAITPTGLAVVDRVHDGYGPTAPVEDLWNATEMFALTAAPA